MPCYPANRCPFSFSVRKFSYLGEDLDEAFGEPEKPITSTTVWERAAEHLHDMLSDEQGVDEAIESCAKGFERGFGLGARYRGLDRASWNSRWRSVKVTST